MAHVVASNSDRLHLLGPDSDTAFFRSPRHGHASPDEHEDYVHGQVPDSDFPSSLPPRGSGAPRRGLPKLLRKLLPDVVLTVIWKGMRQAASQMSKWESSLRATYYAPPPPPVTMEVVAAEASQQLREALKAAVVAHFRRQRQSVCWTDDRSPAGGSPERRARAPAITLLLYQTEDRIQVPQLLARLQSYLRVPGCRPVLIFAHPYRRGMHDLRAAREMTDDSSFRTLAHKSGLLDLSDMYFWDGDFEVHTDLNTHAMQSLLQRAQAGTAQAGSPRTLSGGL